MSVRFHIRGAECPCCGKSMDVDLNARIRTKSTRVNMEEYKMKEGWDDHYWRPIRFKADDDDRPFRTDTAQLCELCAKKSIEEIITSLRPHPALSIPLQSQDHLSLAKAKAYLDPTFNLKGYLSSVPILAELEAERAAAVKRGEALLKKRKRKQLVSDTWKIIRGIVYIAFWTGVAFVVFWLWADR